MTILDKKTDSDDEVTRPDYYGGPNAPFEPVKVIHDVGLGPGFYLGSALKYIQRAPHKGQQQSDLKKAEWYLTNGARLGYTLPKEGEMEPDEIVEAWNLPEGLRHVALLVLHNEVEEAAMRLRAYLDDQRPPSPETAPMPFSKG